MQLSHSPRLSAQLLGATLLVSLAALSAADRKTEHGFPGLKLHQRFTKGTSIPPALGSRIAEVAEAYEHTEAELRAICNKDRNSIHADADARLLYICSALPVATQSAPTAAKSSRRMRTSSHGATPRRFLASA